MKRIKGIIDYCDVIINSPKWHEDAKAAASNIAMMLGEALADLAKHEGKLAKLAAENELLRKTLKEQNDG